MKLLYISDKTTDSFYTKIAKLLSKERAVLFYSNDHLEAYLQNVQPFYIFIDLAIETENLEEAFASINFNTPVSGLLITLGLKRLKSLRFPQIQQFFANSLIKLQKKTR